MTHGRVKTHVKVLQTVAILCQRSGCEYAATRLFRNESIAVFCECHAREEADRIGIDLPMPVAKALHAGSFSGASLVKTNSAA